MPVLRCLISSIQIRGKRSRNKASVGELMSSVSQSVVQEALVCSISQAREWSTTCSELYQEVLQHTLGRCISPGGPLLQGVPGTRPRRRLLQGPMMPYG